MTWQRTRLPSGMTVVCSEPGCPALVSDGETRCEQHRRKRQRYSTNAWQDRRVRQIRLGKGRCARCGAVDDLVLHHVGDVSNPTRTIVMCRGCHTSMHAPGREAR